MAESQPMSLEAFRAKKAAQSGQKKQPSNSTKAKPLATTTNKPTTAAAGAGKKKSDGGVTSRPTSSLTLRLDRARLARDQIQADRMKQLEESKAREAERKAAAEERKRRQDQLGKARKEEILKRSKERQSQASASRKSTSGIPLPKKINSSRPTSSVPKSGISSLSTGAIRTKSRVSAASSGSSSSRLPGSKKSSVDSLSSDQKSSKTEPVQREEQQKDTGSPQQPTWSKLKSSDDNVRSPPKLEIDESILSAIAAVGADIAVDVGLGKDEELATKRQHDREEATRTLLEAEKQRECEEKEAEEQRLFDELEKLTAEEDQGHDERFMVDKEVKAEEVKVNDETEIKTDEVKGDDEKEKMAVKQAREEEGRSLDAEEHYRNEEVERTLNEEPAENEEEEREQQLRLQREEIERRVRAEIDSKETDRRVREETERAERKKRLEVIMQRTRNRAAASPPLTVRSFAQTAVGSLSLSSQQQLVSQDEGAALSSAGKLSNPTPIDEGEMKPLEQGLVETGTAESVSVPVETVPKLEGGKSADIATVSDEIKLPVYSLQSVTCVNSVILEVNETERKALVELDEDSRDQDEGCMAVLAEEWQLVDDADDETDSQFMFKGKDIGLDGERMSSMPAPQPTTSMGDTLPQPGGENAQLTEQSISSLPILQPLQVPSLLSPDLPTSLPPDLSTLPQPDLPSSSPPLSPSSLPPNHFISLQPPPHSSLSPDLALGFAVDDSSLRSDGVSPIWTAAGTLSSCQREELRHPLMSVDSGLCSRLTEGSSDLAEHSSSGLSLQPSLPLPEHDEQEIGLEDSGAEFDVGDQHGDSGISDEEAPPPLPESPPPELEQASPPVHVSPQMQIENCYISSSSAQPILPESSPPEVPASPPPTVLDSSPPKLPETEPPPLPVSLPPHDVELVVDSQAAAVPLLNGTEVMHSSQMESSLQEKNQVFIEQVDTAAIDDEMLSVKTDGGSGSVLGGVSPVIENDSEEMLWKDVEQMLASTIPFVHEIERQTGLTGEISDDQEKNMWRAVESMSSTEGNVGPLPVRSDQLMMADSCSDDDDDDEGVV